MTCEIVVMNKQAVVLAADSATTVTQWTDGKQEVRYFKGANKVFQLSNHQPIGLMTYAAANIQGVPLDIIAKAFREHLGRKSFNNLDGYAQELFDFIKDHPQLFPDDFHKVSFLANSDRAATLYLLFDVLDRDDVKATASDEARTELIAGLLDEKLAFVEQLALPTQFDEADVDEALGSYKAELAQTVASKLESIDHVNCVNFDQLAELAIKMAFKQYHLYMDKTGIVIAGYGDHDYFPAYKEYACYGVLLGRFLFDEVGEKKIGRDLPAVIKPFATTAMVNTFVLGFSEDVFVKVREETGNIIRAFANSLTEKGVELVDGWEDLVPEHVTQHTEAWTQPTASSHAWPLNRVIGSLPIDDMAELAETLILLESLKEKVTQPTETVGGPIDVCVISKYDGFIWIKRKHYFEAERNPHFFRRQADQFQQH